MKPTPSDVHVNQLMTNISIAFFQNPTNFVADRVFPIVPVQKQSDRYVIYDRADFYRNEMRKRAPATESPSGGYAIDNTPTYYADVFDIARQIPDELRANADSVFNLDLEAVQWLTHKALIQKEVAFATDFMATSVWSTDVTGVANNPGANQVLQWSNGASTPIENIRLAKSAILQNTGFMPNILTMGRQVYDQLCDHPDIVDRIKYTGTDGNPARVNRQTLAALLELDEVLVMDSIRNTAIEGATGSYSFIGGKSALLSYRPPTPGLFTPSAGYTFSWVGLTGVQNNGAVIYRMREDVKHADRMEMWTSYDQVRTAADLGYFFTSIVA